MEITSALPSLGETSTTSSAASQTSTVDYDAFLQLLVTQLQNQDPTEPTDNAELMSQLASFSSVEQQVQTNNRLDELIKSNVLGDATNLIGKTVTSADGETSGVVAAVLLADNGIYAELEDGNRIAVVTGTRITDGPVAESAQTLTGSSNAALGDPANTDIINQFGLY
ncbi:MAG: flagellar hook assembly protein FlgD [Pseudomonadota bacterium]